MAYDVEKMKSRLQQALEGIDMDPADIPNVIFHMTDWVDEMEKWEQFCNNPEALTPEELQSVLTEFIYVVPSHLAAASKYLTGMPVADIFHIGATSEEFS